MHYGGTLNRIAMQCSFTDRKLVGNNPTDTVRCSSQTTGTLIGALRLGIRVVYDKIPYTDREGKLLTECH